MLCIITLYKIGLELTSATVQMRVPHCRHGSILILGPRIGKRIRHLCSCINLVFIIIPNCRPGN